MKSLFLRAFMYLLFWIVGFVAFRYIVIDGTLFDEGTEPAWMAPKDDMHDVQRAIDIADFEEAKRILLLLIAKQPNFGAAHERLGYVHLQEDHFSLALEHYRIASAYHPDDGTISRAIDLAERRITNNVD